LRNFDIFSLIRGWGLRVRDVHIQAALMLSVNKRKVG
jgi:hypothetical protein